MPFCFSSRLKNGGEKSKNVFFSLFFLFFWFSFPSLSRLSCSLLLALSFFSENDKREQGRRTTDKERRNCEQERGREKKESKKALFFFFLLHYFTRACPPPRRQRRRPLLRSTSAAATCSLRWRQSRCSPPGRHCRNPSPPAPTRRSCPRRARAAS